MILTGKAKKDFARWCKEDAYWMQTYEDVFLFALIIEWLDSVGIYIELLNEFGEFGLIIHTGDYKNPIENIGFWKTRQKATEHAIIKINKIYNENHLKKPV